MAGVIHKRKTAREILALSKEDLVEYVFVTQDDKVISRLVEIDVNALKLINLRDLRNILSKVIEKRDNLFVYYVMNGLYEYVEEDVVMTVNDYFVAELDNNQESQENKSVAKFLSSIYYIDLDMTYDYEYEEWDTYFDGIKVYDKSMNLLGSSYSYSSNDEDNDLINYTIEEMVRWWRNDNIDNQDLMRALIKPLQIRF
ncbi:MAG: hypothetical protein IJ086_09950 [Clostridium sp.]|nr:hypothetical protein [Clostridium sp.]